jgi:hypothetical protein
VARLAVMVLFAGNGQAQATVVLVVMLLALVALVGVRPYQNDLITMVRMLTDMTVIIVLCSAIVYGSGIDQTKGKVIEYIAMCM